MNSINNDVQSAEDYDIGKKYKRICVNNMAILFETQNNLKRWLSIMRTNFMHFEMEEY